MQEAGKQGIAKQRGKFEVQRLEQCIAHTWQTVYEPELEIQAQVAKPAPVSSLPDGLLTITFETPFRSVHRGKLLQKEDFQFAHFLSPLMRRISMLSNFHHDTPLHCDFKALTEQALHIPLHAKQLYWHDWQRFSSRQDKSVSMGGLTGSFQVHMGFENFRQPPF